MVAGRCLRALPISQSSAELKPVKRSGRLRFFDVAEWAVICAVGVAVTVVIAMGYVRSLGPGEDIEHARSMAMVALIVASATITVGLSGLRTRSAVIAVVAALTSAVAVVQLGGIAELLHLSPLHVDDWLLAGAAGLVPGALASLITFRRRARDDERT
jgi:Ca2+-transporting ATPase